MCICNKFIDAVEIPDCDHTLGTTDIQVGERKALVLRIKWLYLWGEWVAETGNHAGLDDMVYLSEFSWLSIHLPANFLLSQTTSPPTKEITASLVIMRFYINKALLLPIKYILWWYATNQSVLNERNPTLSDGINGWNTLCNALYFIFMLCVDILIFWIQQHVISVASE